MAIGYRIEGSEEKDQKFKPKIRKKRLAGTEGMFMRMSTRLKLKKKKLYNAR